jgi:[protein-PII] uridylyltransferase
MAERAARRLGLSEPEVSDVEFLVREHLSMAHISQRRDLHDLDLIVDFAGRVGSVGRLDQLFLLTYSDMRAVGPDVWNQWKAMLLNELWQKSRHVLEHGALKSPLAERARTRREEVREILSGEPPEDVDRFLSRFDDRYFLSTPDGRLREHLALLRRFDGATPLVDLYEAPGMGTSELVIVCPDRRGLFSTITGTLSAEGINIHNAAIATSADGVALDVFYVSFLGKGIDDEGKVERLAGDLRRVLAGEITVEGLMAERRGGRFSRERVSKYRPTRAVFDNASSARSTVLEVFTYDRLGLLHDITSALSSLGIDIVLSKISTKGDQVADVFYISGPDGGKIEEEERQEAVRAALLEAISRE